MDHCKCCKKVHTNISLSSPWIIDDSEDDEDCLKAILASTDFKEEDVSLSWFDDLTESRLSSQGQCVSTARPLTHIPGLQVWSPCPRGGVFAATDTHARCEANTTPLDLLSNSFELGINRFGSSPLVASSPSIELLANDQSDIKWTSAMATPLHANSTPLNDSGHEDNTSLDMRDLRQSKAKAIHRKLFSPGIVDPVSDDSILHLSDLDWTKETDFTILQEDESEGDTLICSNGSEGNRTLQSCEETAVSETKLKDRDDIPVSKLNNGDGVGIVKSDSCIGVVETCTEKENSIKDCLLMSSPNGREYLEQMSSHVNANTKSKKRCVQRGIESEYIEPCVRKSNRDKNGIEERKHIETIMNSLFSSPVDLGKMNSSQDKDVMRLEYDAHSNLDSGGVVDDIDSLKVCSVCPKPGSDNENISLDSQFPPEPELMADRLCLSAMLDGENLLGSNPLRSRMNQTSTTETALQDLSKFDNNGNNARCLNWIEGDKDNIDDFRIMKRKSFTHAGNLKTRPNSKPFYPNRVEGRRERVVHNKGESSVTPSSMKLSNKSSKESGGKCTPVSILKSPHVPRSGHSRRVHFSLSSPGMSDSSFSSDITYDVSKHSGVCCQRTDQLECCNLHKIPPRCRNKDEVESIIDNKKNETQLGKSAMTYKNCVCDAESIDCDNKEVNCDAQDSVHGVLPCDPTIKPVGNSLNTMSSSPNLDDSFMSSPTFLTEGLFLSQSNKIENSTAMSLPSMKELDLSLYCVSDKEETLKEMDVGSTQNRAGSSKGIDVATVCMPERNTVISTDSKSHEMSQSRVMIKDKEMSEVTENKNVFDNRSIDSINDNNGSSFEEENVNDDSYVSIGGDIGGVETNRNCDDSTLSLQHGSSCEKFQLEKKGDMKYTATSQSSHSHGSCPLHLDDTVKKIRESNTAKKVEESHATKKIRESDNSKKIKQSDDPTDSFLMAAYDDSSFTEMLASDCSHSSWDKDHVDSNALHPSVSSGQSISVPSELDHKPIKESAEKSSVKVTSTSSSISVKSSPPPVASKSSCYSSPVLSSSVILYSDSNVISTNALSNKKELSMPVSTTEISQSSNLPISSSSSASSSSIPSNTPSVSLSSMGTNTTTAVLSTTPVFSRGKSVLNKPRKFLYSINKFKSSSKDHFRGNLSHGEKQVEGIAISSCSTSVISRTSSDPDPKVISMEVNDANLGHVEDTCDIGVEMKEIQDPIVISEDKSAGKRQVPNSLLGSEQAGQGFLKTTEGHHKMTGSGRQTGSYKTLPKLLGFARFSEVFGTNTEPEDSLHRDTSMENDPQKCKSNGMSFETKDQNHDGNGSLRKKAECASEEDSSENRRIMSHKVMDGKERIEDMIEERISKCGNKCRGQEYSVDKDDASYDWEFLDTETEEMYAVINADSEVSDGKEIKAVTVLDDTETLKCENSIDKDIDDGNGIMVVTQQDNNTNKTLEEGECLQAKSKADKLYVSHENYDFRQPLTRWSRVPNEKPRALTLVGPFHGTGIGDKQKVCEEMSVEAKCDDGVNEDEHNFDNENVEMTTKHLRNIEGDKGCSRTENTSEGNVENHLDDIPSQLWDLTEFSQMISDPKDVNEHSGNLKDIDKRNGITDNIDGSSDNLEDIDKRTGITDNIGGSSGNMESIIIDRNDKEHICKAVVSIYTNVNRTTKCEGKPNINVSAQGAINPIDAVCNTKVSDYTKTKRTHCALEEPTEIRNKSNDTCNLNIAPILSHAQNKKPLNALHQKLESRDFPNSHSTLMDLQRPGFKQDMIKKVNDSDRTSAKKMKLEKSSPVTLSSKLQNFETLYFTKDKSQMGEEGQEDCFGSFENVSTTSGQYNVEDQFEKVLTGFCRKSSLKDKSHNLKRKKTEKQSNVFHQSDKDKFEDCFNKRSAGSERNISGNKVPQLLPHREKSIPCEKENEAVDRVNVHGFGISTSNSMTAVGFSTAGGKTINISEQAKQKAEKVMESVDEEFMNEKKSPFCSDQVADTEGKILEEKENIYYQNKILSHHNMTKEFGGNFLTAGGKDINLSDAGKKKANSLWESVMSENDTPCVGNDLCSKESQLFSEEVLCGDWKRLGEKITSVQGTRHHPVKKSDVTSEASKKSVLVNSVVTRDKRHKGFRPFLPPKVIKKVGMSSDVASENIDDKKEECNNVMEKESLAPKAQRAGGHECHFDDDFDSQLLAELDLKTSAVEEAEKELFCYRVKDIKCDGYVSPDCHKKTKLKSLSGNDEEESLVKLNTDDKVLSSAIDNVKCVENITSSLHDNTTVEKADGLERQRNIEKEHSNKPSNADGLPGGQKISNFEETVPNTEINEQLNECCITQLPQLKGFATASGKRVSVSERALNHARQFWSDSEMTIPCNEHELDCSDKQTMSKEGGSLKNTEVFQHPVNRKATVGVESDILVDETKLDTGCIQITNNVRVDGELVTVKDSHRADYLGFDTLSCDSDVQAAKKSSEQTQTFFNNSDEGKSFTDNDSPNLLAAKRDLGQGRYKETDNSFGNKNFVGFSTASGCDVFVSKKSLDLARAFLNSDENVRRPGTEWDGDTQEARQAEVYGGKELSISDDVRRPGTECDGDTPEARQAEVHGGKELSISDDVKGGLEDGKTDVEEDYPDEHVDGIESCGQKFVIDSSTPSEVKLFVSENYSKQGARMILDSKDDGDNDDDREAIQEIEGVKVGFSKALGKDVTVSRKSLEKVVAFLNAGEPVDVLKSTAKDIAVRGFRQIENRKDGSKNLGGFCTALGSDVFVSNNALEKAKTFLNSCDGESVITDTDRDQERFCEDLDKVRNTGTMNLTGFSTAAGNQLFIPEKSLQRTMSLFDNDGDEIIGHNRDLKKNHCDVKVSKNSRSENFGGFSTASGLGVSVSKKSLEQAKSFLGSDDDLDVAPQTDRNRDSHPSKGCSIGFSTASGIDVSVSKKSVEQARAFLGSDEDLNVAPGTDSDKNEDTGNNDPSQGRFIGFSTASGLGVSVSKKSLEQAKSFLGSDDDLDVAPRTDRDRDNNPSKGCSIGFSTASGLGVSVSRKSLEQAKTFLGGDEDIIVTQETDRDEDNHPSKSDNSIGFSTASSAGVSVSRKALEQARAVLHNDEKRELVAKEDALDGIRQGACGQKGNKNRQFLKDGRGQMVGLECLATSHDSPVSRRKEGICSKRPLISKCEEFFDDRHPAFKRQKLQVVRSNDLVGEHGDGPVTKERTYSNTSDIIQAPYNKASLVSTSTATAATTAACKMQNIFIPPPSTASSTLYAHKNTAALYDEDKTTKCPIFFSKSRRHRMSLTAVKPSVKRSSLIYPGHHKLSDVGNTVNEVDKLGSRSERNLGGKDTIEKDNDIDMECSEDGKGATTTCFESTINQTSNKQTKTKVGNNKDNQILFGDKKSSTITENATSLSINVVKMSNDIQDMAVSDLDDEEENRFLCENVSSQIGCHVESSPSCGSQGGLNVNIDSHCGTRNSDVCRDGGNHNAGVSNTNDKNTGTGGGNVIDGDSCDSDHHLDLNGRVINEDGAKKRIQPEQVLWTTCLMEARMKQDKAISDKKRQKVVPRRGRLMVQKEAVQDRKETIKSLDGWFERPCTKDRLLRLGVSETTLSICCENASGFKFDLRRFYPGIPSCVLLGDGASLVPDKKGFAGCQEFYKAFLTLESVDPKLVDEMWIQNHYRWIVWKLAAYEVCFPSAFAGRCLTPNMVMLQLKYRCDKEVDRSQRSAIKKIVEKDDAASKRMVLCVAGVQKDTGGQVLLEMTDGWYSIWSKVDKPLSDLVSRSKIAVGVKVVTSGAELEGEGQGCSPLEMRESVRLSLRVNSTRPAPWDSKLGFQHLPMPLCVPISSLHPDGGVVGCVDVVVTRIYPVMFMEKLGEGGCVFRTQEEDDKERKKKEARRETELERIYQSVQASMEEEEEKSKTKTKRRGWSRKEVEGLCTGEELLDAWESAFNQEDIQSLLNEDQMQQLLEHRQMCIAERQEKMTRHIRDTMQEQATHQEHKVTPVQKFRIVGCSRQDIDCKCETVMTVWRPTAEWSEIHEGQRYRMFHLGVSASRWNQRVCKVVLASTRQTRIQQLHIEENLVDLIYQPRELLSVHEIHSLYGHGQEFDFLGVALRVESAGGKGQPIVIISADRHGDILSIKLWKGLQNGIAPVKENESFVALNLTKCQASLRGPAGLAKRNPGFLSVTAESRQELSSVSTSVHSKHGQALSDFRQHIAKTPEFVRRARCQLENEAEDIVVDGRSDCTTPSADLNSSWDYDYDDDFPPEIVEKIFNRLSPNGTVIQPNANSVNETVIQPNSNNLNDTVMQPNSNNVNKTSVIQPNFNSSNATVIQPNSNSPDDIIIQPNSNSPDDTVIIQPNSNSLNNTVILPNSNNMALSSHDSHTHRNTQSSLELQESHKYSGIQDEGGESSEIDASLKRKEREKDVGDVVSVNVPSSEQVPSSDEWPLSKKQSNSNEICTTLKQEKNSAEDFKVTGGVKRKTGDNEIRTPSSSRVSQTDGDDYILSKKKKNLRDKMTKLLAYGRPSALSPLPGTIVSPACVKQFRSPHSQVDQT